ncbi:hypothetical protein BJF78_32885 [Pseudonocardia sp. CNS-139]|nr:hypothetical protein BJF78_32885 [Pseudonocardia sp. CNS-139]
MSRPGEDGVGDPALHALDELCVQLAQSIYDLTAAKERLDELARLRAAGTSWSEIVQNEDRPLVVETITAVLADLGETGSRFRREEARALHHERMSMTRIGELFGVSRQRVSTILRGQQPAGDRLPGPPRAGL